MSPWVLLLALSLALPWLPAPSLGVGVLLALLLGVAGAAYAYATRHFGYWRRRGVPFLRPLPIAGNLKDVLLFRKHMGDVLHDVYTKMKGQPYLGMYFFDQPVFFVKDVSLWKNMMNKDYEYFQDRGFSPIKSDTIFSETLFARKGQHWKDLRLKLNPAFTQGKLKRFYPLIERKAASLAHYFDNAVIERTPCDITLACARYAMDAVATLGFGIETSAVSNDNDPLNRLLRNIFVYSKIYTLVSLATFVDVPLLSWLRVSLIPEPLRVFLRRTIWGAVEERQRAGTQGERKDILDLLMELREKGRIADDDDEVIAPASKPAPINGIGNVSDSVLVNDEAKSAVYMDGDVLIAQAFSIFSAGFDTTSTTMSFALYHLAMDEPMQEKLRTLLQKAVQDHGGQLTYDAIQSVEYLDMIFSETLRLYPVLPFLDRTCTKTYRVPGSNIVIDKGVFAYTSIIGIHRDPQYFPDPERFNPERFSEDSETNIPSGCYLPFGGGPRKCIGMRIAYLQGKVAIAHIILNYRLHPCATTPTKMEFDLHSFLISPRDGVPLKLTRVEK